MTNMVNYRIGTFWSASLTRHFRNNMQNNYWKNKKVIIAGSEGFLGSHFVEELNKLNSLVIPAPHDSVDLLDREQTKSVFKDADILINCAALDGNTEFKIKYAVEILDWNLRIVSNILNAAKANNIKDIVLFSSAEIYSPDTPNPIKEEDDYRAYKVCTLNGYILSKIYGEILSDLYHKEFNLRIYLPRPSNIFGPKDHFSEASNRVIPSFIKKAADDEPIEVWGDGSQIRQFIYVKDVVHTVLSLVERNYTGVLNVSTNEFTSILDLAKIVYKCFNKTPNINFNPYKSIGVKNRILDTSKMHALIDFNPLSLESGIRQTINWYKKTKFIK